MKIKVTKANRIISSVLTISGAILFFVAFGLIGYFIIDRDLFKIKLPRMSENLYFNICDHIIIKDDLFSNVFLKSLFNSLLISLFWFQHILMANNRLKMFLTKFSNYPTYERGLYIFISDLILLIFLFLWQPIPEIHIFSFRGTFLDDIFKILVTFSLVEFIMTIPFMLQTDLFGLNRLSIILKNEEFTFPVPISISTPFIYRGCRHPMQSGFIGMFIFSSSLFNFGRLIFVLLFICGIIIGVNQEEEYLSNSKSYLEYKNVIKNKFIPNPINYFDKEIIRRLQTDRLKL